MENFFEQAKSKYKTANTLMRLIYINIAMWVLSIIISFAGKLIGLSGNFMYNWFALDADLSISLLKPWTFISYGFLHDISGIWHLLFNMVVLYYIGQLFLEYFTGKQLIQTYIISTLFGGLFFTALYNINTGLNAHQSILVGASAAVTGILVAMATYIPYYGIRLMFLGNVKLWVIAAVWVGIDLLNLLGGQDNIGGRIAHLGGAFYGYLFIRSFQGKSWTGIDFSKWFKAKPLKTVHKSNSKRKTKAQKSDVDQEKIDVILDKIGKSGYDSLSKEEKQFLFKQGKS